MEIYYGYQLPDTGEIEWIIGNRLLCSEWESDDYSYQNSTQEESLVSEEVNVKAGDVQTSCWPS